MLHRTIALLCTATALCAPASGPPVAFASADLMKTLKKGGYTLYFRHAITDRDQRDRAVVLGNCATQRNLKTEGREQARKIGAALSSLALPVGEVIASPYCRTRDTAMLIAGRAQVVPAIAGMAGAAGKLDFTELGKILATPPAAGTLRLIAGHEPSHAFDKAPKLEEGEAMVVEATGDDWKVVARIYPEDWERLAAAPAN
jgi:phosphohistidine phosphatase SixA